MSLSMQVFSFPLGGLVSLPLLLLGFVALIIFLERMFYLHRRYIRPALFLEGIQNLLLKGRVSEALTLCEDTPGPVANIVKTALQYHQEPSTRIYEHLQAFAFIQTGLLERRLSSLYAIAMLAPLLGVSLTLLGFSRSFEAIQALGPYANSAYFLGNLSACLKLGILSLGISIFSYIGYYILNGRVRRILYDMELAASSILALLYQTSQAKNNGEHKP